MEEIREMFKQLQADVNDTKNSLREMESNITKNVNNNINEMVGNLQVKIQTLETENELQERRLDTIERTQRQRNLVMFGVEEKERGYSDLVNKILNILNDEMNVNCTLLEIQALRRIGRKGDKIRPIVISFTTLGRKIDVQKNWKSLQNTRYSIAEDYPPKVLEIRKTLYEQARTEKVKGNKVLIKYDKLIILQPNPEESRTQATRNTKRALSQTPPQTNPNNKTKERNGATQAQKKNKISSYWAHPTAQTAHSVHSAEDGNKRTGAGLQKQQQQ
ncbi:Endonuclease-reverse transcriptase [Operophtera brumata]|uniref:Endonuclease-reverse transcriptase n=1 Tax=Operophtera brumata TaxID=104452 RepID=A0A0L7LL17_OPEBR|nr:Endonuclease-reverse transcriptase [Operophtera brumata]KOB78842.1 Endonuclease-reverse transcriptase [Operophtera brumata]KOB79479.1 Endonuclease-reverse transcriptase [Operophtera brumata]